MESEPGQPARLAYRYTGETRQRLAELPHRRLDALGLRQDDHLTRQRGVGATLTLYCSFVVQIVRNKLDTKLQDSSVPSLTGDPKMHTLIVSAAAALGVLAGSVGAASAMTLTTTKHHFHSSIEQVQHWSGRGCRAIGVTINGRAIPGVSGRGFGRDACSEALRECRFALRQRKRLGANPFGRCIVLR